MDDIKEMTGEAHYGSHKKFDEVVLHGDTGRFLIRDKNAEKDEETGKYPRKDLGKGMAREFNKETQKFNETGNEPLSVVFLKIRR
ncbi:MAG TPA: hypothetical protein ENI66_00435, partial [Candidatus Yonathbacteria bacterium]|nr:hypothetical protein [Candidatus Yonathbacteria bacterium]